MGDHALTTETITPTANSVGGSKAITELLAASWVGGLYAQGWVQSGFTVPASDADLVLTVTLGTAFISGYRITATGTLDVTCAASTTNHIFLKLSRDGGGKVTGAVLEVNATGVPPADSAKLATATTSGTAVTSTEDQRYLGCPVLRRSAADVTITTTTETAILRQNLKGGTLGTDGAVRLTLTGPYDTSSSGIGLNPTIRVKYGATTMVAKVCDVAAGQAGSWECHVLLMADGATNAQFASMEFRHGQHADSGEGFVNRESGTAGEDSTLDKVIEVTYQAATASGPPSFTKKHAVLELL